ncbi:hypothetical protein GGI07_004494 [Coemansia sp. Benny D115]|nr:hypothetical protein GGI07_004494 [Coemansia sp. Benny D115]
MGSDKVTVNLLVHIEGIKHDCPVLVNRNGKIENIINQFTKDYKTDSTIQIYADELKNRMWGAKESFHVALAHLDRCMFHIFLKKGAKIDFNHRDKAKKKADEAAEAKKRATEERNARLKAEARKKRLAEMAKNAPGKVPEEAPEKTSEKTSENTPEARPAKSSVPTASTSKPPVSEHVYSSVYNGDEYDYWVPTSVELAFLTENLTLDMSPHGSPVQSSSRPKSEAESALLPPCGWYMPPHQPYNHMHHNR